MRESEKMQAIVVAAQKEIQASSSMSEEVTRRSFLRQTVALAGGAGTLGMASTAALAQPLPIPASNQTMGAPLVAAYGMPSKYEANVIRRRSDVLVNRQQFSDWSMTPIQSTPGIVVIPPFLT